MGAVSALEVPTGIVSNNQHETIENVLEYADVGDYDVWYDLSLEPIYELESLEGLVELL
ncbi:hypothetical protein [Salinadaptatus halalkaliphilus]|uniref:hypothetical protein n=1 Tax=Salinadaptatus halalkaliphilus TaxID=2419781 RepID=UPI001FE57C89|nr:hypothetical protein [Salinadaptatus halalkaliphilus]